MLIRDVKSVILGEVERFIPNLLKGSFKDITCERVCDFFILLFITFSPYGIFCPVISEFV